MRDWSRAQKIVIYVDEVSIQEITTNNLYTKTFCGTTCYKNMSVQLLYILTWLFQTNICVFINLKVNNIHGFSIQVY